MENRAGFLVVALLPPAIMFLAAGRTDWWEAWAMAGLLALATIVSRAILILKYPDLAVERSRWTVVIEERAGEKPL